MKWIGIIFILLLVSCKKEESVKQEWRFLNVSSSTVSINYYHDNGRGAPPSFTLASGETYSILKDSYVSDDFGYPLADSVLMIFIPADDTLIFKKEVNLSRDSLSIIADGWETISAGKPKYIKEYIIYDTLRKIAQDSLHYSCGYCL